MTDTTETRFKRELNSFFAVTLLNVVFGAQAVALGVVVVVASVLGTMESATPALRVLAGALALACFGLGIAWIRSSALVLRGVAVIRRPFRRRAGPVSDEAVTAGIVGMIAHYRENRPTIRRMVLVCAAGGLFFLAQGVVSILGLVAASASVAPSPFTIIPGAGVTIGLGIAGLLSAYYFTRFSRSWDLRLEETARAEERLKSAMEMETE